MPFQQGPGPTPNWRSQLGITPGPFVVVDDDSDSWFSNANLTSIPIALAAATIAASVAASWTINRHNDELIPYQGAQAYSIPYGRRAQYGIVFNQTYHQDEIPPSTPATLPFEDEGWIPPSATISTANGIVWATDDDGAIPGVIAEEDSYQVQQTIPTSAKVGITIDDDPPLPQAATFVSDDYSVQIQAKIERIQGYTFSSDDEIFTSISTEEGEWQSPLPVLASIQFLPLSGTDEQIVPQPAPLNVEEEYDIRAILYSLTVAPIAAVYGGDEEIGTFVAPPTQPGGGGEYQRFTMRPRNVFIARYVHDIQPIDEIIEPETVFLGAVEKTLAQAEAAPSPVHKEIGLLSALATLSEAYGTHFESARAAKAAIEQRKGELVALDEEEIIAMMMIIAATDDPV